MPVEPHDNLAVLFADISGSTQLYATVGDDHAREIVARTLELWSSLTAESSGSVVQLRGDGLLATFPTIDAALTATVAMRDLPYDQPLSMHAGLNAGPMLRDAEQLYGDTVNLAARMADIARKFEIVMTGAAYAQLSDAAHWPHLRLIRKIPVKGWVEPMDIYLLPYDRQPVTDYRPPLYSKTRQQRLTLRHGEQTAIVDLESGPCLIGRDDECRIKVVHRLASRRHASVECIAGRFFLQDHSTNGTYIREGDQPPVLVQRELYQLKGRGAISLGLELQGEEQLIVFTVGTD